MESPEEPPGVVVFIDAQNVYRDARRAFFDEDAPSVCGQIDPVKYSRLLTRRVGTQLGRPAALRQVRIYTGRPDAAREPVSAAATARQVAAWEAATRVVVSQRPLRYPPDWPTTKAQQKGVDVQLATDLVQLYLRGFYQVGVVASTDTDMRPGVESVLEIAGAESPFPPVFACAWNSPKLNNRLWLIGRSLYCFHLRRPDYDSVMDPTRYGPPKTSK